MHTALIILAAVVVLIGAIVALGMRYLRADDDDGFDDARGRAGRSGHDLDRTSRQRRRSSDQDMAVSRAGQPRRGQLSGWDRDGRERVRGEGAEREWRGEDRGRDRGQDQGRRSGHNADARRRRQEDDADERGWRTDEGRQVPASQRSQGRTVRVERASGRPERGDSGEFSGVGAARADRGQSERGSRDRGELAAHARTDQHARDARDGKRAAAGRDVAPDHGDRRPDARSDGDSRSISGTHSTGSTRSTGSTGPNSRSDGRRASGQGKRDALPAVRPRQGRSKHDKDGDWPSNEWDELSDVDYWAEVASDKPLTNTAQPAGEPARRERSETRRVAEPAGGRQERPAATQERPAVTQERPTVSQERPTAAKLPVRPRRQEIEAPAAPDGRRQGGDPRSDEFSMAGARRSSTTSSEAAGAMLASRSASDSGFRPPLAGDDDDPLTSPSFPRIADDDGRSYRRNRGDGPPPRDRGATPPGGHRALPRSVPEFPAADYPAADHPAPEPEYTVPEYSAPEYAVSSYSPPDYPAPSYAASDYSAPDYRAPNYPASDYPASDYRAPDYPAPDYRAPDYPAPGYSAPDYPAPSSDPYQSIPSSSSAPQGYPIPAAARAGNYPPASPAPPMRATDSFPSGNYQAQGTGSYPVQAGYPADQGRASFQAATSPYPIPAGYPAYGAPGMASGPAGGAHSSGPHQRPAVPAYPSALEPPFEPAAQLSQPGQGTLGQQPTGYPSFADSGGYHPPVAALPPASLPGAQGMGYGGFAAAPSQPVPATGQPAQYYPAPTYGPGEPAGFPSALQEPGGYANTDPYAADPYGHPGYRAGGY